MAPVEVKSLVLVVPTATVLPGGPVPSVAVEVLVAVVIPGGCGGPEW